MLFFALRDLKMFHVEHDRFAGPKAVPGAAK